MRKPRLNNMGLGFQRRELAYEAVMTDLCLLGIISQDQLEALTGTQMGSNVKLPDAFYEEAKAEDPAE